MTKTTNMMNNNTITAKSVDPRVAGFGLHRKTRRCFNSYLHATKFVIKRVDISYNKLTGKFDVDSYYSIVDDCPLIREFGLSDRHEMNFLAFDVDGEDNKKKARRINIDGQKYVLSENIMAIQCNNKRKIDELADKGYEVDGCVYMAATASPSNEKHSVKYYAKLTNEVPDEEAIFWKIDKLMGGSLSDKLMKDPKTGLPVLIDGKLVTKANTRIGNYASGMVQMGNFDLAKERVAVVHGSMNQACDFDPAIKEQMIKDGINIDENINDGAGYFSANKVRSMFRNTLGIKLTEDQAMRVALQTRWTGFTAKIMARTLKASTLEALAKFYNAEIFGNPEGELVALIDTDGAKMINFSALRNNEPLTIYVMAMANASGVRSCGQHLIKYIAVDEQKTLQIVSKLATLAADDFVANKLESDEANTDLVNARIMANLTPEEIYEDAYLMEAILSDTWTYCKSMIAENKIPLEGVYTHMMFDLSYALVNGVIDSILSITKEGFIEAYSPDVLRIYADEISAIENDPELTEDQKDMLLFELLSGTVVKFPSAMAGEYELIVYQTNRQIKRKIVSAVAELDITNEEKVEMVNVLVDYFEHSPWGCTVYAPVNAMKNKLAGADVDFDATMCDMSELKWILINKRLEEQEKQPGFMGDCTFISYKDIVRQHLEENNEDVFTACDDVDM